MACSTRESLEFHAGGNDWEALCRAKERLRVALLLSQHMTPLERERCQEMLSARSIEELELIRAAWAEVCAALPQNE